MNTTGQAERRDIRDEDLHGILEAFYDTLEGDDLLASYFEDLDMSEHMPRIVAFWSTILFGTQSYSGNAFAPHQKMPGLTSAHFARWVETMEATIEARFSGAKAEEMKTVANRIAYSMQLRLGLTPFAPYQAARGGSGPVAISRRRE